MQPIVTLEVRAVAPPAPEFIENIHGQPIPWHLLNDAALQQIAAAWLVGLKIRRRDAGLARTGTNVIMTNCTCDFASDQGRIPLMSDLPPDATSEERNRQANECRRALDRVDACPVHGKHARTKKPEPPKPPAPPPFPPNDHGR